MIRKFAKLNRINVVHAAQQKSCRTPVRQARA
jgi:hypothetical protein